MDLRQLRHFIAVAEELHFGRAAARLGIKQPPLSQSIQRLEQSLGVTLFSRSPQHVRLTAAGRVLLPEARDLVARADGAVLRLQLAAKGERDRINLGFIPWTMVRSLPQALRLFSRQWPGVKVDLSERTSRQQIALLEKGRLDLGLLNLKQGLTEGLSTRLVERSRMAVAVPASWPLARESILRIAQLEGYPLIIFSPQLTSNGQHDTLMAAFQAAGFTPQIAQETTHVFTMLSMVANELGIALVQSTAASMPIEGTVVVPLEDPPAGSEVEISLAWDARNMSPALGGLIDHIEASADSPPEAGFSNPPP